jgi:hypothetical protein
VPDGFKVVDMRSGEKLELIYDGVVYRGFLDAGIVPLGVAGFSCLKQLRVGVELKQTAEQKENLHPDGIICSCLYVEGYRNSNHFTCRVRCHKRRFKGGKEEAGCRARRRLEVHGLDATLKYYVY